MSRNAIPRCSGRETPIAAVPPELLSSIFQEVLPDVMDAVGREAFHHLRMVCSRWRALCLSTPQLWTSLMLYAVLPIDEQDGITAQSYAELLEGWFKRAGSNTTLELTIEYSDGLSDEEIKDIIRLIHSLQGRWHHLHLDFRRLDFWDLIAVCPQDGWTNLRHIVVTDAILDTWMDTLPHAPDGRLEDTFPLVKTLELTTRWSDDFMFSCVASSAVETLVWHALEFPSRKFMDLLSCYSALTNLDLQCGPLS
ncbi:hypothetical protein BKA70DRAFT_1157447 [Coprinopsis sp. MPI-PUGE-AT-0042]|nr:hypothetical protein BKA70DRAFT_1157447 [Coprinopsis sp. MPI-PUGE-AT-0042]